jgi:calcium-dependent protein kinase
MLSFNSNKAKNKFKQAIMTYIATQVVSQQEKEELMKSFKSLDKDSDGKITRQELIEGFNNQKKDLYLLKINVNLGYMKILNNDREVAEQEVDKIMEAVDTNKTGVVDFSGRIEEFFHFLV